MAAAILATTQVWVCASEPSCGQEHRSSRLLPNRLHACPRKGGLTIPMVPVGTRAKVEVREREDHLGEDAGRVTTYQTGMMRRPRPVMSAVTTRDHGQDCAVYVPHARASLSAAGIDRSAGAPAAIAGRLRSITRRLATARP